MPQKAAREAIAALAAEAGVDAEESVAEPTEAAARVTRRRSRRSRAATPSTKPMEQMLWDAGLLHPRGERRGQVQGLPAAASLSQTPFGCLRRRNRSFGRREYGDREVAQEIAENDHDLLRFYLPPEARWGVISGRETHQWPLDDRGRSTRPRDIGEHLTRAVRAVVRQNPSLSGVIDLVDFRLRAQRRARPQPGPARRRGARPFPIPDTGSASPTCSPTFWAVPTSTCSENLPKVPARARVSFSPPPRSASSWPTSCARGPARTATTMPAALPGCWSSSNWWPENSIPPATCRSSSAARNCRPKATPSPT